MTEKTWDYFGKVVKVIDGDTIRVLLDLGLRTYQEAEIRILGLDCPEMNTEEGKAAKVFLEALLPVSSPIYLITYKNKSFNRWLGDVYYNLEYANKGVTIASAMIEAGHGKVYIK